MNSEYLENLAFEQAHDASKTVRTVIITIASTCIIIFLGLYNSFQSSWISNRLLLHEYLLVQNNYLCPDSLQKNSKPKFKNKEDSAYFVRSVNFYISKGYTQETLKENYRTLVEANINNRILFKLPVVSSVIDINDLSVAGGMAFLLLLSVAYMSLLNKKKLVGILSNFLKTKSGQSSDDELAFEILNSNHIINLNSKRKLSLSGTVFRAVYFTPPFLCLIIVAHDCITMQFGNSISPAYAKVSIWSGTVLAIFNLIIAGACAKVSNEIDKIWIKPELSETISEKSN